MNHDRRRVLRGLAASAVALGPAAPRAVASGAMPLPGFPFRLGVASGFPADDGVVLWTRLAPLPGEPDGGMPPLDWPVRYEVAEDEAFRRIVRRGRATAEAAFAHSVRVEVKGLRGARDYWYRFIGGDHASPVGRTRTLPAPRATVNSLRLAVASCQHYESGHYAAWRHVAADAPDLVLHLGDYIYEGGPGPATRPRLHTGPRCTSLADFRRRYALYQSDPALQAAHAAAPWFITWDDHEVGNDYSGATPGRAEDPQIFLQQRAAAYQAWYEHVPAPPSMVPRNGSMRIYARARLGNLATLHLLDQRQYRAPQSCARPPQLGGQRLGDDCTGRLDPARSMLGTEQERWLARSLASGRMRWTLLAQGTPVAHMNQGSATTPQYWSDAWTGYPAARQRLLDTLRDTRSSNPVVFSGDIHAFLVAGINAVPERLDTPLAAAEFATTSISSDPVSAATLERWRALNPNLHRLDGGSRGYLAIHLDAARMRAELIAVDDVRNPDSGRHVQAAYVVEAGRPDILPG